LLSAIVAPFSYAPRVSQRAVIIHRWEAVWTLTRGFDEGALTHAERKPIRILRNGPGWAHRQLPQWAACFREQVMAKNETTGKKAGTAASKVLKSPASSKNAKTAAGSALTQRPNKKK
jgi:hypothetical protein